jgi:hypothetical protein
VKACRPRVDHSVGGPVDNKEIYVPLANGLVVLIIITDTHAFKMGRSIAGIYPM